MDVEYPHLGDRNLTMEERQLVWEEVIKSWWNKLSNSIQKCIIALYNELCLSDDGTLPRSLDGANNPPPMKALKLIVEAKYPYFRTVELCLA